MYYDWLSVRQLKGRLPLLDQSFIGLRANHSPELSLQHAILNVLNEQQVLAFSRSFLNIVLTLLYFKPFLS